MNELEWLRRLGAFARNEADPVVDLSDQVRRRLRKCGRQPVDRRLAVASLCACSIATLAVAATIFANPQGDSVTALAQMVTTSPEPETLLRLVEQP